MAPRKTMYKEKAIPPLWQDFLTKMKQFRIDAGLSRRDVAEKLDVSIEKIANWEDGSANPHPYDLCVYMEAVGIKSITPE